MTDFKGSSIEPKADSESWCLYRERIFAAFRGAGNETRRVGEGKVAFNRRVKAWASTAGFSNRLKANESPQRRFATESLRSYRERIRTAFYEAETLRSYRERIQIAEGKVAFNRRVKAWANGKPYTYVAPSVLARASSPEPTKVTGYVVPETPDGTKHVAFLEHPLFYTTKVIMHMRHIPTNEYDGLQVSSLFNGEGGTEHVYIRHNNYWGSKVVLRRLDFVDNPDSPVLNTYLSYDEPGGLAEPARNVIWNNKYKRGA